MPKPKKELKGKSIRSYTDPRKNGEENVRCHVEELEKAMIGVQSELSHCPEGKRGGTTKGRDNGLFIELKLRNSEHVTVVKNTDDSVALQFIHDLRDATY